MSGNDRPLKRARLSGIDSTSPASPKFALEQHDEFWLPDGNIILVANKTTAFRIYRGLIASQSTVFEDMFTASTSNSNELFEGCPVIHLSDSPHDLAHLLRVLLPKSKRLYHGTSPRTFDEVSAVIRLAHKYHIQDVQDQALASLQICMFSSDFDDWFEPPALACLGDMAAVIGVVNLARLTDTPTMLPGALYTCSHLGGRLLDGWVREDGTVEHLSAADLRRCLDAHHVFARESTLLPTRVFAAPQTRVEGCKTPNRCRLARQCALVRIFSSEVLVAGQRVLGSWEGVIEAMVEEEADEAFVCEACENALLERNRKERWAFWKRLPEIFGITVEGWGSDMEDEGGDPNHA